MKAMLWTAYGPPEVLQLGQLPTPEPKRGQVRIRVHASAVTYSDTFVRRLAIKPFFRFVARLILGFNRPKRWPVLGIVVAGEIDRVGAGVTAFREGDQVFGMNPFGAGAYAEYLCMKAGKLLVTKPANLTYREAAAIPYGGLLALHFLRAAKIAPGMRVLIYGASGATGSAAVQLAKHFGAHVTGVCSADNRDLVKSLGAESVIDYARQDFTTMDDRYDLVFAAVGDRYHPPAAAACRRVLAAGGRYVSVDGWNPKLTLERLLELQDLAASGALRAVIDRCYPLADLAEAHRYVETKRKKGNVVIMMDNISQSQTTHRWYTRPVFFVADVNRAARFYIEMLGFEKGWHADDGAGTVCQVNHGECEIILCEHATRRDKGRLFIELTAEALTDLRREFVERSVPTRETWWGYDTLQVDDPDGNELLFPGPA